MTETLTAINIVDEKTHSLMNAKSFPILFYWNGDDETLLQGIKENNDFIEYVKNVCKNDYVTCKLYYFFFDYDNDEKYVERVNYIQDILPFNELDKDIKDGLIHHYLLQYIEEIYKRVFNKTIQTIDLYTQIKTMYNDIKIKYGDRISCLTFVNYVRSKFENNDDYEYFTDDTKRQMFTYLTNILTNDNG